MSDIKLPIFDPRKRGQAEAHEALLEAEIGSWLVQGMYHEQMIHLMSERHPQQAQNQTRVGLCPVDDLPVIHSMIFPKKEGNVIGHMPSTVGSALLRCYWGCYLNRSEMVFAFLALVSAFGCESMTITRRVSR
jgi:hypothetical protein